MLITFKCSTIFCHLSLTDFALTLFIFKSSQNKKPNPNKQKTPLCEQIVSIVSNLFGFSVIQYLHCVNHGCTAT